MVPLAAFLLVLSGGHAFALNTLTTAAAIHNLSPSQSNRPIPCIFGPSAWFVFPAGTGSLSMRGRREYM